MPQASDELRAEMKRLFGDEISDTGPMEYLHKAGYKLNPRWDWIPKPNVKSYEDMTKDEWLCLKFLRDEWDFGVLALEGADNIPKNNKHNTL